MRLTSEIHSDLKVWAGFLLDGNEWLPIPSEPSFPPIIHKEFTSDAAGLSDIKGDSGVAAIGVDEEGILIFAARVFWDDRMLRRMRSGVKDVMGNDTVFLEAVGILLPFVLIPERLMHQHVVCKMDNIACFYSWDKKYVKEDIYTTIIFRSLFLISSFLATIVHVKHLPRMTTWEARLTDRLSRRSSTSHGDRELLKSFGDLEAPQFFKSWLDDPTPDWDLPLKLICFVESCINKARLI